MLQCPTASRGRVSMCFVPWEWIEMEPRLTVRGRRGQRLKRADSCCGSDSAPHPHTCIQDEGLFPPCWTGENSSSCIWTKTACSNKVQGKFCVLLRIANGFRVSQRWLLANPFCAGNSLTQLSFQKWHCYIFCLLPPGSKPEQSKAQCRGETVCWSRALPWRGEMVCWSRALPWQVPERPPATVLGSPSIQGQQSSVTATYPSSPTLHARELWPGCSLVSLHFCSWHESYAYLVLRFQLESGLRWNVVITPLLPVSVHGKAGCMGVPWQRDWQEYHREIKGFSTPPVDDGHYLGKLLDSHR